MPLHPTATGRGLLFLDSLRGRIHPGPPGGKSFLAGERRSADFEVQWVGVQPVWFCDAMQEIKTDRLKSLCEN